jgi:zinc transporter, ZIP family
MPSASGLPGKANSCLGLGQSSNQSSSSSFLPADVSFAEIFLQKSVEAFVEADYSDVEAYRYSTLAFFAGFVIIFLLDQLVHMIVDWLASRHNKTQLSSNQSQAVLLDEEDMPYMAGKHRKASPPGPSGPPDVEAACCSATNKAAANVAAAAVTAETASPHDPTGHEASGSRLPPTFGVTPQTSAAAKRNDSLTLGMDDDSGSERSATNDPTPPSALGGMGGGATARATTTTANSAQNDCNTREQPTVMDVLRSDPRRAALHKMGLLTAFAIFLHNLPEGLATFVAALSDTGVGIGIAVAIAVHNIPEGICVALPIYYATGSRRRAFLWAMLSGLSEPVGAFLGWLVLYGDTSMAFAIVFALVAGMMVYISIKELLPMALRYDPKDSVASTSVIVGMVIMASSLLLFTL